MIGIVGGAGPMASSLLLKKIVTLCQKQYGCVNDSDFPKILLLSYPFAEMLAEREEERVSEQLEEALSFLVESGATCIGIACNTLHNFLRNTFSQLIPIVEEKGRSNMLTLCTRTSSEMGLFGGEPLSDEEQEFVDQLIRKVLKGEFFKSDARELESFVRWKKEENPSIEGVLLGCTELSVFVDAYPLEIDIEVVDPLEILSEKLCKRVFDDFV